MKPTEKRGQPSKAGDRVLVTGGNGQLASAIRREFAPVGEVFSFTRAELDITDAASVRAAVARIQPTLIVNDLKLGDTSGAVALWIGPGTEGYFTGLSVKPEPGK